MFSNVNERSYDVLHTVLDIIARLGMPLIILAWFSVFAASVFMIFIIKRYHLRNHIITALIVGIISLIAHLVDYFGTLGISPDLSFEANPIWRIVVENMGLSLARWYGLTGKVLLSILSFEFFIYYLAQREKLLPSQSVNLVDFWNHFGVPTESSRILRFSRIKNFFAYLFGLIGPFCFYVALLNSVTDIDLYMRLPSMPFMLMFYLIVLTALYILGNYWSFKRRQRVFHE